MSYKRCCVPGCSVTAGTGNVLHEFPNPSKDRDRFMIWINSIGGEILKLKTVFVYMNRRVCRMHFEAKYHCRYNRLSNIAVPTINMPCLNENLTEQTSLGQEQNLLNVPSVSTEYTSTCSTQRQPLMPIQNLPIHINVHSESEVSVQCALPCQDKENIGLDENLTEQTPVGQERNLLNVPSVSSEHTTEQQPLIPIQNLPMHINVHSGSEVQCDLLCQDKENIVSSLKSTLDSTSDGGTKEKTARNRQKADTKKIPINNKVTIRRVKMTRAEQDLYRKLQSVKRKLYKCKNKVLNQAMQLKQAKKIFSNPAFIETMEKLSSSAKILFMLQIREQKKKGKGRRFDLNEKILALSLLKQSPKAYRFLRRILILPAPHTLTKLLTRANIKPGINKKIFDQLKSKSAKMKTNEKLCILLFDEMSLKTNVTYNERKDYVTGFVTNGKEIQTIFANHAQVFMIRGLQKNYKQPVSYTFSSGATKGPELAQQLKEIVRSLQETGFIVVATVCDQGTNNRQAIKRLIDETRGEYLRRGETPKDNVFVINEEEIVPLYDPPHLLKGIRNNLLTKNLIYEMDGKEKVAKWQHLELLHGENPGYKGVRLVPKLTDNHIVPQKIGKMKVKYASQVFSATVASNMGYLADKKILPEQCKETADVLLFFDKLFDSVNGSFINKSRYAKPLLGPVTPTSIHRKTWNDGKNILKSMKFVSVAGKKEVIPTLNSWVWTLEGMEVLLKNLEKKYNISSIWMRHLNQDPIENFFGAIRSHGCRNTNPTPERFESAFATLLINSLTSVHAPGGNCENDFAEAVITIIDEDCITKDDSTCLVLEDIFNIELEPMESKKRNPKIFAPLQYVSGYFINKTKKIYKSCNICKESLLASEESEYIKYREYADRRWLCSPSDSMVTLIAKMQDISIHILKTTFEIKNLKQYISTVIYALIDFKNINCVNHKEKLIQFLINSVCRFFIYNYCKDINKILSGKKDIDDINDKYQVMAKRYFQKCLKIKKK